MTERSLEDRINHLHKLIDSYRQENETLKDKLYQLHPLESEYAWVVKEYKRLKTFVEKARGGFKIWYHYHHGGGIDSNGEHVESVTDRYIVAQNIASYEDAEQLLQMYESYNNNEYVTHIITSPAEGNDELPF